MLNLITLKFSLMKKYSLVLVAFLTIFLIGCEGPRGLDGFDGLDGLDGADGLIGSVVDVEGTFNLENDYTIAFDFPNTLEVFETDVVLVYLLFDQTEDSNGDAVDIWRLMPQTRILDQGLLQYNFDYTFFDVTMFLEADFDLTTLMPGDTDNQVFRIAVLPAESIAGKSSLDRSNISEVMSFLDVNDTDIQKIKID